MKTNEVSEWGLYLAVGLSLVATIGAIICHANLEMRFDLVWLTVFACSLLTLSGAAVNFDPKRLIK